MKKMTKIIAAACTAAALFIGTNVNAQTITSGKGVRFGIGVEGLLPTGNLHDISNVGVGITPRLQFGVADNIGLTLTSGYLNYFGKEYDNTGIKTKSYGMIPVKAGIKAFVSQNIYLSGEVGAAFETSGFGEVKGGPDVDTNTKLLASPGIGWANKSWDVGVRYENYSGQSNNFGAVGLRLAYGFGL
ncbi:hypothetical protein [Mucilaginibacter phyllosphaerae]|uniref:Outer membrane protein beta-barrel domain-containing protein n=1 Tax=Mucilaginibacter phyllosphaerae TaxID=1812349 RepID=A0A4Y8AID5_9SPHI|nr:hypothetical protein [Mucilaginibacter phyllosphaerae]MBB3968151.1 hypothetical protein [Mucilaginibacter phyllosphaerae]TEW68833.1 hypothetical protein E2R65_01325 [Mucilaginibacter phyllosphaerae]GGH00911.1 hypothetical protein GCM10007352_02390 [Mucilaginibacter phyllosphaerae]